MIGKRITAHVLNRVLLLLPSFVLLGAIAFFFAPNYFIFGKDDSGWLILYLFRNLVFLPTVFYDLIRNPLEFVMIIKIILPTLLCIIFLEIISILFLKADLGMKIMGLKIISIKKGTLSIFQITLRTIVKYISLAFFPFVLIYIFNKEHITVHDKLSSTKVVLN